MIFDINSQQFISAGREASALRQRPRHRSLWFLIRTGRPTIAAVGLRRALAYFGLHLMMLSAISLALSQQWYGLRCPWQNI